MAAIRKYQYNSICREKGSSSSRTVGAENLSKAIDVALETYITTWKTDPDSVEVSYAGSYTFN